MALRGKSKQENVQFETTHSFDEGEPQIQNNVEQFGEPNQGVDETVPVGDVDVDFGETDEVDTPATAESSDKAPKAEKAPARPPVPEGYVTPVEFAKQLTEHLEKQGASNKNGPISKTNPVPPQMVYSYIKSNGPSSKNPLPTYEEGGRSNLLKAEEALAWWDAKAERTAASKAAAAEKAARKAAAPATETAATTSDEGEAVEAE
jgi:hypothetical protein